MSKDEVLQTLGVCAIYGAWLLLGAFALTHP